MRDITEYSCQFGVFFIEALENLVRLTNPTHTHANNLTANGQLQ
jgi:hypothetical protein